MGAALAAPQGAQVISAKRRRECVAARRVAVVEWINRYLEEHPCVWCGEDNPIVLEFDHIDHGAKRWEIARAIALVPSVSSLELEVSKTQVLCANCHRIKTAQERGSIRWRRYGHIHRARSSKAR